METKQADAPAGLAHIEKRHESSDEAMHSQEDVEHVPSANSPEFKALLRKIDRRVIPVLAVLYLLSFLDRGSIGNANVLGLSKDLHLVGNQYNWALTIFFFPYSFFEPASNLLLVRFKPSRWLPSIMVAWGICTTLTGIVQSYSGLLAVRFFLGLTESGLFPGITFYVSLWYPRQNAQLRLALIFASASMAGAFSGLLAYLIGKMEGVAGLEGWRWIFILEGMLTVIVAIASYFFTMDEPATANFLSDNEKRMILQALHSNGTANPAAPALGKNHTTSWKEVVSALADWQTWFHAVNYWGMACAVYALSLFLPTIINGLGYTAAIAQLLTIPVYTAATICCVIVGYLADKTGRRGFFVLICYSAIFLGFLLAVAPSNFIPGLTYAGCFIAACGIYPGIPGLLALSSNNYAPHSKRAVGMAIQIGFGTMGGAAAANFYFAKDAPRYRLGHSLVLAFVALGLLTTVLYYVLCRRINSRRDRNPEAAQQYSQQELIDLGDRAPTFRYIL
ncbi:putative MFS nicotinic acid transporter Tna1 [Thozetella sp. PMI_491]|nr:putative MFS nicotinic acid transporter Tna1 [Thozetella sp. PMI_491]